MKLYIACHDQKRARRVAKALRAAGFEITSRWLKQPFGPSETFDHATRVRFAMENYDDVRRSVGLVLVAGPERYSGGKFMEAGFAYALGKPVCILGRRENVQCYGHWIQQVKNVPELVRAFKLWKKRATY